MNIETLVRNHPATTLFTLVGGTAFAATFAAYREMGKKPHPPRGALSRLVYDHPVLALGGGLAVAVLADHFLRPAGSHVAGVRMAATTSRQPAAHPAASRPAVSRPGPQPQPRQPASYSRVSQPTPPMMPHQYASSAHAQGPFGYYHP
jgi:hypothetical protein